MAENPLIVQSDRTLLLDVHSERAEEARASILPFAELEKSPEHIHTYRITPLSLWNAASAGLDHTDIVKTLAEYTRYQIPSGIFEDFSDTISRFGKIRMTAAPHTGDELFLEIKDDTVRAEIGATKSLEKYLIKTETGFLLRLVDRGTVKWELIQRGWPVQDEAPLVNGDELPIALRDNCLSGKPFSLRDYQLEAAHTVLGDGKPGSGYGVVALPCGSGKTIVGMIIMSFLKTSTLILTANVVAVHQWIDELMDKTDLSFYTKTGD
jgi:DNA excision repair protein ERCC-3